MLKYLKSFFVLFSIVLMTQAMASPQTEATHDELRKMRDEIIKAWNEKNFDAITGHLSPNVVITWQNGDVSRGREDVRNYFRKMMEGPERVVDEIKISPTATELTILMNDETTGIAFGTSEDEYKLRNGFSGKMLGHWSVTMIKENGKWLIANFHSSVNAFANPFIESAKKSIYAVGLGALFVGLLIGMLILKLSPKKVAV